MKVFHAALNIFGAAISRDVFVEDDAVKVLCGVHACIKRRASDPAAMDGVGVNKLQRQVFIRGNKEKACGSSQKGSSILSGKKTFFLFPAFAACSQLKKSIGISIF